MGAVCAVTHLHDHIVLLQRAIILVISHPWSKTLKGEVKEVEIKETEGMEMLGGMLRGQDVTLEA